MSRPRDPCDAPFTEKGAVKWRLVDTGVLDVDVAAEASVEEQIPAGVIVVVVDVDLIAVPIPVAAAGSVVSGNDPVGAIEEDEAARANVKGADDVDVSYVLVATVRIGMAWADAGAVVVPAGVMGIVRIVPALMIAVIVAIALVIIAVMLIPALVLAVVVAVVAVALRRSNYQTA